MKKSVLAIILLGVCLSMPAFSTIRRAIEAPNVPFSIDGTLFPADSLSDTDLSLVEKELQRLGITDNSDEIPHGPQSARLPSPESGVRRQGGGHPSLPAGLRADRTFTRPGSGGAGTEIALGSCAAPAERMKGELTRRGWNCSPAISAGGQIFIGSFTRGKETQIVVLEEKRRQFLFLRRMEE